VASFNINETISGLRTTPIPYVNPGPCRIAGKLSLPSPNLGSGAGSTVVVTVNQNGTPVYTSNPGADGFETGVNISNGDVITVVTSSSSVVDQQLNAVKMTLSVWEGGE
jgi:hypothetical protein